MICSRLKKVHTACRLGQPSFSGIGLTVGNGLAAADDARSFIGSDRAKPDTAKSAHHAIEP